MAFMQLCKPSHKQTYCSEQDAFNASSYECDSQSSEYKHQEYGKQCSPQRHGGHIGQHHLGGGHTGQQHLGGGHTGQQHLGGGHTGQHHFGGGHIGQHHGGGGHIGETHRHSGSKKYSEQDWSETDKFSAYGYNAGGNAFGSCLEKKEEHDSYFAVKKNSNHKHGAYRKKHGDDSCSDSESDDDEDCRRKC